MQLVKYHILLYVFCNIIIHGSLIFIKYCNREGVYNCQVAKLMI